MRVHLSTPPTVGTPDELRDGMAGQHADLYRRTLDDIARVARFAADTPAQHVHVGATRSDETEMDAVNRTALEEALGALRGARAARLR